MLPEYFALVGVGVASLGGLYYLYRTIQGTVKPNRMTWFFWGAFPMIAFAAQLAEGVGLIAWITFVSGLVPFLVLTAAIFNPQTYWEIRKLDYAFAAIGIFSIWLWYVTKNPTLALTFALLADFAVAIPTIIKTYKYPETEAWKAYGLNTIGFGLGVLSIQIWTYENYAFVIYLFIINLFFAILASRKPSQIII